MAVMEIIRAITLIERMFDDIPSVIIKNIGWIYVNVKVT